MRNAAVSAYNVLVLGLATGLKLALRTYLPGQSVAEYLARMQPLDYE
jgi:hypothetical protein